MEDEGVIQCNVTQVRFMESTQLVYINPLPGARTEGRN